MRQVDVFDGTDIAKFKDWRSKLRVLLSLHAPEVLSRINGKRPPTDDATATVKRAWTKAQMELFSLLFLITSGPAHTNPMMVKILLLVLQFQEMGVQLGRL